MGGKDVCWSFAKTTNNSAVSEALKARCEKPGALNDPACFGDRSYACSRNEAGQPFELGNRYEWCSDTVRKHCESINYQHELCSCMKPFTEAEMRGLGQVGVAANRFCFGGADASDSQQLHLTCRQRGYNLFPSEQCQDVCAVVQTAINFGKNTMLDSAPVCDRNQQPRLLSYPGDNDTLTTWNDWWKTGSLNFSNTSVPKLADFAASFARAVAKSDSLADLEFSRAALAGVPDPAKSTALGAVEERKSALSSTAGTLPVGTDSGAGNTVPTTGTDSSTPGATELTAEQKRAAGLVTLVVCVICLLLSMSLVM